jgi:hypothetical protein
MRNSILLFFILSSISINALKYKTSYICNDNKILYIDEILGKYILLNQKGLITNDLPAISYGKIKKISRDTALCVDSISNDTIILTQNYRQNKFGDLKVSNINKYLNKSTKIYILEELDETNRLLYYSHWRNGKCIFQKYLNTGGILLQCNKKNFRRGNDEMRFLNQ